MKLWCLFCVACWETCQGHDDSMVPEMSESLSDNFLSPQGTPMQECEPQAKMNKVEEVITTTAASAAADQRNTQDMVERMMRMMKEKEKRQKADTDVELEDDLNTIEETASEMNCKELIETPIWREDIRTTEANIRKEACVPSHLQPHSTSHGRARDTEKR